MVLLSPAPVSGGAYTGAWIAPTSFVEALGLGGYGSLNLDVTYESSSLLSPHLRVGFWDDRFTYHRPQYFALVAVPVEVGFLIGRTHRAEVNIGYTYEFPVDERADPDFFDGYTTLVGWLGYRYQREQGGLFGKIGVSAAFDPLHDSTLHVTSTRGYYMAVGMGYTFKRKAR